MGMLINENKLYDNLSQIEVGDIFTVVLANGGEKHSTVEGINNSELLLRSRGSGDDDGSGDTFTVNTNTAIEDDKIIFMMNGSRAQSKTTFTKIVVSDSNRKPKFIVTGGLDPEEEERKRTEEEKKREILKNARDWRVELMSNISDLGIFDEGTFSYGQPEGIDDDGEIIFKSGTEGELHLEVEDIEGKLLYVCNILSVSGYLSGLINNYKEDNLCIYIGGTTFNTSPQYINYAVVQLFPKSDPKNPILLSHVYAFDGDESDDDEDEVNQTSLEDMLKDKNLKNIMNKHSAWDKVLGRKAVGVDPLDKLKQSEPLSSIFGFNKKRGQQVHFIWSGENVKGGKLEMLNNKEYRGYMYDNKTIKISGGKNNPENIMITIGKMVSGGYNNATATKRDSNKNISKPINGKIQILNK